MSEWKARLEKAQVNGKFTDDDKTASGSWPSCAVGELKDIAKTAFGRPRDSELAALGNNFDVAVQFDEVAAATEIYNKIRDFKGKHGE